MPLLNVLQDVRASEITVKAHFFGDVTIKVRILLVRRTRPPLRPRQ